MFFTKAKPEPEAVMTGPTADYAAEMAAAEAAYEERRIAALTALKKPENPYRIRRQEPHDKREDKFTRSIPGMWVVEAWRVRDFHRERGWFGAFYDPERDLQRLREKEPILSIEWDKLGAADGFPTLRAAQAFLKAWVKPELAIVEFDANGERAQP